jgi:hypothetical protein
VPADFAGLFRNEASIQHLPVFRFKRFRQLCPVVSEVQPHLLFKRAWCVFRIPATPLRSFAAFHNVLAKQWHGEDPASDAGPNLQVVKSC